MALDVFQKIAWRRIKALVVKEFFQVIRDPSSLLIAIVFPVVLLFLYGVGVSLDMDNLNVGVVLQDSSSEAQSFALSMRDSKYFSLKMARDQKELEKKITAGTLRGLVVIPFYFTEFLKRPPQKAPIYVIADGSEPNTANFVQNYVQGAWNNWLHQEAISNGSPVFPGISVAPRFWYNEELVSRYFLIPGSIALIMALIGTLLTSLVITREWERGTMEALMTTPITMGEFLIAKVITYFAMGIGSMILCTTLSVVVYGLPFRGTFPALFLVSSAFLLAALATGLLISSVTHSQFIACQISGTTAYLPAFMLSGFIFEISSMPQVIQWVTDIVPAKYLVSCLQTLFLVGDVWSLMLSNIFKMVLLACAFFILIAFKIKKRLE